MVLGAISEGLAKEGLLHLNEALHTNTEITSSIIIIAICKFTGFVLTLMAATQ